MALPPPEVLQATILNTLATNADGGISDTRTLTYNGQELRSGEEQGAVKGVLDSLWSKEVSRHITYIQTIQDLLRKQVLGSSYLLRDKNQSREPWSR